MKRNVRMSTSERLRATWEQTAMANFSPTHARTPPPKGTQASGFTAAASGVPSMNRSGMNTSGACNTARHHSLFVWWPKVTQLLQHGRPI